MFHDIPRAMLVRMRELEQIDSRDRTDGTPRMKRLRSEEHTSELQSPCNLVCRLLLEKEDQRLELVLAPAALDGLTDGQLTLHKLVAYRPVFFFFNDTATPEIYPLSLHDPLPIFIGIEFRRVGREVFDAQTLGFSPTDRKSTRLNSSHLVISYAVFCLKKKKL